MERSQPRPDSPEILKVNEKDRWDGRVVYQIYPNTFNEVRETGQEHTGYGSLAGITEKLDYVRDLGANAIWLNPMYPDGGVDGGYDIADYTDIRAELGTMEDFDRLIAAAHERDILVMLDFVPSHSSDKHPWFEASRVSRDNPHSDTYIWRDAAPDGAAK